MRKLDPVGSKSPELRGNSGLETLDVLAPFVNDTARLTRYFGNDDTATAGARVLLNNLELVKTTVADAYAGNEEWLRRKAITVASSSVELGASLESRRAKRRRMLLERGQGQERDLASAVVDDVLHDASPPVTR